jgi:hypothetical protein
MDHAAENNMSKLMGALIAELATQVPTDSRLEIVRSDLLAASTLYQSGKRDELTLRFYLVITFLLRELQQLNQRLLAGEAQGASSGGGSLGHGEEPPVNRFYQATL